MIHPLSASGKAIFDRYAGYYDVYYSEKDYPAEVGRVMELAERHRSTPIRVLDMGCGTGRHMRALWDRGIPCDGFDISDRMAAQAMNRLKDTPAKVWIDNILSFRTDHRYDLVISLFAVMGYLRTPQSLVAGLRTAAHHLKPGGLFVFDGWFGPAVLHTLPETRTHVYRQGAATIQRHVVPALDPVAETVTANYTVSISEHGTELESFQETHVMRYFFYGEVALAADQTGLDVLAIHPFPDIDEQVTLNSWNVLFLLRKPEKC